MHNDTDLGPGPGLPPDLRLATPRVLVVEDEMTVAMLIEDMINELSYELAGVAARLEDAMRRLDDDDEFDVAMLDVQLGAKTVFPFAAELDRRGIPYLFASAYGGRAIPAEFGDHPVLQKPFGPLELGRALVSLTGRA
ncbi:MAG: response regulator [Alphaproteobacteria bacterium]|nr:response regulator [Alphaproteobacteria bacterium]